MIENPFLFWAPPYQTHFKFACDANQELIDLTDPTACKWCAWGWMCRMRVPNKLMSDFDIWLGEQTGGGIIHNNDDLKRPPAWFRKQWDLFMASVTGRKKGVPKPVIGSRSPRLQLR
jgi:hypothetical protein